VGHPGRLDHDPRDQRSDQLTDISVTVIDEGTGAADIKAVPVRHPGRWIAALVIAVLAAMLVHSFFADKHYGWSLIQHSLFASPTLHGLATTIELTVLAMVIGIAGGILLAVMRLSPNPVVSTTSAAYIWFFRGTPVLVQIVIWFNLSYLFPHLSLGIPFGPTFVTFSTNSLISKFSAAMLGLGLNEAAYMAEIVRAGILSVDEGQSEAASALGMSRALVTRRVVLPQAMRVIVPPTGNEVISMLKTSSLASFIALSELFEQGQNYINRTYATIPYLLMVSIWYLILTSVLTIGQGYIERYYGRGSSRQGPTVGIMDRVFRSIRYRQPPPPPASAGLSQGPMH
jgi:polar amino acid transport system permease protein